jgi:hypothetical protein
MITVPAALFFAVPAWFTVVTWLSERYVQPSQPP